MGTSCKRYILIYNSCFLLNIYVLILATAAKSTCNASLTDLSKCKLTQFGTEYAGSIATTAGGIRCQMWRTEQPLHKVSDTITDEDVPERSLQLARNYCRNPTKDPRGPWCYTMESTLIDDACEIPLCNFGECRITGTGSEYGGTCETTSSGKKCRTWDKRLKLAIGKTEKFSSNQFPDLSRNKAKNFCRNPDSSAGGPWCYVDSENYEVVEKEYCSVPFCDDKDCLVYTKNASMYSTLTSLNKNLGNMTFWIKLWNPADEQIAQARLLFTHLQVPTSAEVIAQKWRAGVEIVLSNSGSGQEYPRTDKETDFEETPRILLSSEWTALWVTWGGGFISVGREGSSKPIFLDEFKKKDTISSMYPESFFQYGIMGTGVLWSMQFCEETCEVHTTFGTEFLRVWPLLQTNNSHDLQFYVRATHKATVQLTQTPTVLFPCLFIVVGQSDATLVMYQEKESSTKEILLDLETKQILNFWTWTEFTISIFGTAMQMFWNRAYGREEVFSVEHHSISTMRWFSVGSENTLAHWTLFCSPTETDAVEAPWFPNCISSSSDSAYQGSQWTSEGEIPCVPWIYDKIPKDERKDDLFIDGSALKALNKCRNPTKDSKGPFCFIMEHSISSTVKKQYCSIRKCRSSECRMAGTANDYLGPLSVTRSGRNCAPWVSDYRNISALKKNVSLSSLIARAFVSLKEKRENALKNIISDVPSGRWDEIGLRLKPPRELDSKYTRSIFRQRMTNETTTSYGINKLLRNRRFPIDLERNEITTELDESYDFLNLNRVTFQQPENEDYDVNNIKPATFFHPQSWKNTIEPPEDYDIHNIKPATFLHPENSRTTTTESDEGTDFLNLKRFTFPHPENSKTTTTQSDEGTDFLNLKRFTFPHPENSKTTTPESDEGTDFLNLKRFTFPHPENSKTTTTESDEGTDFLNLKRFTFPHPENSKTTTPESDEGTDFLNLKRFTFPHPENSKTTTTESDEGTDFLNLKRFTFPHPETSKTTSTIKSTENDDLFNWKRRIPGHQNNTKTTSKRPKSSSFPQTTESEEFFQTISQKYSTDETTTTKNNFTKPVHEVDIKYLNDTLYPEQNARNASNFCRNPSRNIAGTWCYTTDPEVPQDLCNVRDCEQPEECTFFVRGSGSGRRLYVLPEYRSEGLRFSLKEWEPDRPDSITFVILSEDDVKSRFILKVGAMKNEKVLLYYENEEEGIKLVKQRTLPHLLYLGKWTGFVIRMELGGVKLYYEGAPYPLFEWSHPEPEKAFLPVYYYYSSELGNTIGVAFNCETKCHIEQTSTERFTRILPISIWEKEETPSPHKLVLMVRGEGVILVPLLLLPTTPGYYALTIGDFGQWVYFIRNKRPVVHIFHRQDAKGPLFTPDTWTNLTIQFYNYTIKLLRNGTEVFHYVHDKPLLFYFFSFAVEGSRPITWAANCIPTDIDGDPLDGGWSEWGPWSCSASCNGGTGIRKRICNDPEPNIRGQPCLGPSTSSGQCNMNKCEDVSDGTLELIKRRIRTKHTSIVIKEGDGITLLADKDIVSALKNETPTSKINWSRNGIFLEKVVDRIKLEDTAVIISYTVVRDSGVYTQTLHRIDGSHLIFKIITLGVIPFRNELIIRETLPFSITCHCVVLGYVYSDLSISWTLNGKVYKDYGVSTPVAVNVDHIPKANTSHHAEWRCIVTQNDLNFKWTTNVIKVRVLGPPNWRTHLMEDKVTRPIFGWMPSERFVAFSAFFLTFLIILAIILTTRWYLRFRKSLKYKEKIDNEELFNESESEKLIKK